MTKPVKFVDRPEPYQNSLRRNTPDRLALLETATNGKAVRIPLEGQQLMTVQGRLRLWLKTRGYRLHYRHDGDAMLCWATKKTGPGKGSAA